MAANRFFSPFLQYLDSSGDLLIGGSLTFYVTGTTTLASIYTEKTLSTGASNPQTIDASGRLTQEVFLDPSVTYKCVLKDADGTTLVTYDPVVDLAVNAKAAFYAYAGDPNGNVAGTAATPGSVNADVIFDTTNKVIWVCTTTGTASTAVWEQTSGTLTGAVAFTGGISPSSIGTDQDDYAPAGLSTAAVIRQNLSAACALTGLSGGSTGRKMLLHNISDTYTLTLSDQDANSVAANRFLFGQDVLLGPYATAELIYDATTARWRAVSLPWAAGRQTAFIPAGSMVAATTSGPSSAQIEESTYAHNYTVLDFDGSSDELACFTIVMPKAWDGGTIAFRVTWQSSATDTDGVAWALQGVAIDDEGAIDAAYGTAVVVTDTAEGVAGKRLRTDESSAVTIAGSPAGGQQVDFRLYRDVSDAADTMAEDARLIGLELYYNVNAATDG